MQILKSLCNFYSLKKKKIHKPYIISEEMGHALVHHG